MPIKKDKYLEEYHTAINKNVTNVDRYVKVAKALLRYAETQSCKSTS